MPRNYLGTLLIAMASICSANAQSITTSGNQPIELALAVPSQTQLNQRFLLQFSVTALHVPPEQAVGIAVSVASDADGSRKIEVGRVSLYPLASFTADEPEKERFYRVDITKALSTLNTTGVARIELKFVDRLKGQPTADSKLTISNAQIVPN